MIIEKRNLLLEGSKQRPIVVDVFAKQTINQPIIIFCHGYKGFKDWGCWDLFAKYFVNNGYCFVKFNFSHNGGTVKQPIDFPDVEAFPTNNYTIELNDLEKVITWVVSPDFPYTVKVDVKNIVLIGHSRGGAIATIKASENKHITQLVTLAGVSDFKKRFGSGQSIAEWKKNGVMYVENSRTKQQLPHYYQFYQDFIENEDRLTVKNAAQKLNKPHLIIHGTGDLAVLPEEAQNLHQWSKRSELFLIEHANHVFGGQHPWHENKLPEHLLVAAQKTISFIENNKASS